MKDQNTTVKAGPREFFLQLLSAITLYMSAYSLSALLFIYFDMLTDPNEFSSDYAQASIRSEMAILIVSFPVYFYTVKKYRQYAEKDSSINSIRLKAWLSYLTLFLASLFIIGDLGTVVYEFLGSELSTVFFIKAIVLSLISALVFYYHLRDLKQNWQGKQLIIFATAVWMFVLSVIVYGLFFAGAPFKPQLTKTPSTSTTPAGRPLITFPTQTGNPSFQWASMQNGKMPANALTINNTISVCQGQVQGNNYPGQYVNTSCRLTYGGNVFDVKEFVILTHQNDPGQWLPNTQRNLKTLPIYAGFENGQAMALCRITANGVTQLGKVVANYGNTICNVAMANQEVTFNKFEILYPSS